MLLAILDALQIFRSNYTYVFCTPSISSYLKTAILSVFLITYNNIAFSQTANSYYTLPVH